MLRLFFHDLQERARRIARIAVKHIPHALDGALAWCHKVPE